MTLTQPVRTFLQHPHVARLSVIDNRGYPHTIPIWYALDGNDLIFFSGRRARKIGHVQANSKGAVSVGGDPWGTEGYLLKGEFTLEDDPGNRWMSEITHRYVPKERADQLVEKWAKGNMVLMRFKVSKAAGV